MRKTPEISIVFPTYERRDDVRETLRLLRQNLSLSYETIILDNSAVPSPPDTGDAGVRYVFMGDNVGAYARNRGIAMAEAPYVLMLDDDSHPLPGGVEAALATLDRSPETTAGVIARVERQDGGREGPPLLPTVFHGCGALFKTEIIRSFGEVYPLDFMFYVEEYWVTLALYAAGYYLEYDDAFRVCHRMSATGRDKGKILRRLTSNNIKTWNAFAPEKYRETALYDNNRRYELISAKENVPDAYPQGVADAAAGTLTRAPMSETRFEAFGLLTALWARVDALDRRTPLVLCGAGKFPCLWSRELRDMGFADVEIADFNTGLIGKPYGENTILSPEAALDICRRGARPIVGHGSFSDSERWRTFLSERALSPLIVLDPAIPLKRQLF